MNNDRKKGGSLAELRHAIELLMNAHTRDDDQMGFVVETMADLVHANEPSQYIEAWRIVRAALGYQTEPMR